ncbi:hypothetical protein QUA20_31030 [Microcoleus sp. Pol7_A1]|uniref:hypothetical protein n=1 Tax=Microcoleus sp. Pol7_A1 TaxID=2818893 RepID=UPI002FD004C5
MNRQDACSTTKIIRVNGIFCSIIINLFYGKTGTCSCGTGILPVAAFCSMIKVFLVIQEFFLVEQARKPVAQKILKTVNY